MSAIQEVLIQPRSGWQPIDLREIWRYRELLGFLVWRDLRVRYKQTVLGGLWAVLQPLIGTIIFGLLFTRVAPLQGDGSPYPLFICAGLVPWTFFANSVSLASNSLISAEQMVRKIYFPRIFIPLGAILALGVDMLISFLLIAALMAFYGWPVSATLFWLPLFVVGSFLAASGLGFLLSALNVRYRDVKYVVSFVVQMAFFLTPVLYPLQNVPGKAKVFAALNPMAGIIEGFRHAWLGSPVSWELVGTSMAISLMLFLLGLYSFRRLERTLADVI